MHGDVETTRRPGKTIGRAVTADPMPAFHAHPGFRKHAKRLLALALAIVIASSLQIARAAADEDDADLERALQAGEIAPLNELLARVREDFAGRLLQVELEHEDIEERPGWVYEAKVLTPEGNVLKLEYDAGSLELLEVKGHRGHGERDHDDD